MEWKKSFLLFGVLAILFQSKFVFSQQSYDVIIRVIPKDATINVYNSANNRIDFPDCRESDKPLQCMYKKRLPAGTYTIEISKAGNTKTETIIVPQKENDFTVRLPETENKPDKISEASSYSLHIKMPDDENIVIKNLPPGKYDVEVSKPGYDKIILSSEIIDKNIEVDVKFQTRTITCNQHSLKFVRVGSVPDSVINIALKEEDAKKYYNQAGKGVESPLMPYLLRAVSEKEINKDISEFWIQAEPISEELYKQIIPDGSVNKISYNDATRVIQKLNEWCQDYKFDLPTEEQIVYLARQLYNPVKEGELKKCSDLKELKTDTGIKYLLGNNWQLTKSECEKWSEPFNNQPCYVKKGGTADSKDITECMPEYRAESSPDVREPDTTMRLILITHLK